MDPRAAIERLRTPEGWLTASAPEGRFGSLFGRDALVSALQLLPVNPSIAHATLERLGRDLGRRVDPETEEEPGKVLHEARDRDLDEYVAHGWPVRDGRLRYYGSIDAGPWFLIVLGALARAGEDVSRHVEAARRVAGWLVARDMPLAYARANPRAGLVHQGWRDVAGDLEGSGHGVVDAGGRPLRAPVALAEVTALAWRGLVEASVVLGGDLARHAERARSAFMHAFVGTRNAPPAFARHGEEQKLDRSATSDLGHVLWTGILDELPIVRRATHTRLRVPDIRTPFGLRTLAASHDGFRPDGYHTGAVWPFDTWLGAGGLDTVEPGSGDDLRAGVVDAVTRLGAFPELYVVELDGTLRPHPESCEVQAWTVGAVLAIEAGWDGRAWAARGGGPEAGPSSEG